LLTNHSVNSSNMSVNCNCLPPAPHGHIATPLITVSSTQSPGWWQSVTPLWSCAQFSLRALSFLYRKAKESWNCYSMDTHTHTHI